MACNKMNPWLFVRIALVLATLAAFMPSGFHMEDPGDGWTPVERGDGHSRGYRPDSSGCAMSIHQE